VFLLLFGALSRAIFTTIVKLQKNFNLKIVNEKTKSMTIAKIPLRCKLVNDDQITDQVLKIKYLGIDITSQGLLRDEVKG
jgi:hypothetical protein